MEFDTELLRDLPGVDRVVRHRLEALVLGPEGDRVGVYLLCGLVGQDGDDARIQAAGQEARHRHVGHQVRGDGFLDHRAKVRGRSGGGFGRHLRDAPVPLHGQRSVRAEQGPGTAGQLAYAVDGTSLLGQPPVQHRRDQGARIDPQLGADGGRQRLQLGGEDSAVTPGQVVQRLDAERVTSQDEIAGALVEQRKREHAPEALQGAGSPAPPGLEHHLGVGLRPEPDAVGGQLGAQRPVVVQLAVVDDRQAVLAEGLIGRRAEIDDRQAPEAEVNRGPVVSRGSRFRPSPGHDARCARS